MAKPKGKDMMARPIAVGDLSFDDRFRIGGAQYIEQKTGRSFLQIASELGDPEKTPTIGTMAVVLTALYLQRHPDVPPDVAEKTVGNLDLNQMGSIMAKLNLEIEEKNSNSPDVDLTETRKAKTS